MKAKKIKWPKKPSNLILLALHDLNLAERDPKYDIDMSVWHQPASGFPSKNTLCYVCFAGSVMAKSLKRPNTVACEVNDFEETDHSYFYALNTFRLGAIEDGFSELGITIPREMPVDISWDRETFPAYASNRNLWWQAMLDMVGMLQAFGQ
jgi:hypothetical protein